jgi:hypothetical protein
MGVPVTHERAVKWGPLERGDLRNQNDLQRVFEARRPWVVGTAKLLLTPDGTCIRDYVHVSDRRLVGGG